MKILSRTQACAPTPPHAVLDRKQAAVAAALEWLDDALPAAYATYHVFVFPAFQVHESLGGDADLSPMMFWTAAPFAVPRRATIETAVLALWAHAERAMGALVDGSATPRIKAQWLDTMAAYADGALPRYAGVAGHHTHFFAYRLPVLAARHGLARTGSTFALFLNTRSREHPAPFAPVYPTRAPPADERAGLWDYARPQVAALAGDVVGYLESTLMNDRAASFGFTLFPLE